MLFCNITMYFRNGFFKEDLFLNACVASWFETAWFKGALKLQFSVSIIYFNLFISKHF